MATGAPARVTAWLESRPDWIEVRQASLDSGAHLQLDDSRLDAGERAAIELALTEPDALLLIDETAGRSVATRLGITNTGTLGVLVAAARSGLVDLQTALNKLLKTNFRISQSLIARLLADTETRPRLLRKSEQCRKSRG